MRASCNGMGKRYNSISRKRSILGLWSIEENVVLSGYYNSPSLALASASYEWGSYQVHMGNGRTTTDSHTPRRGIHALSHHCQGCLMQLRNMWLEYVLSAENGRMLVSHPPPVILCRMNHKHLHHLTRGKDASPAALGCWQSNICWRKRSLTH